MSRRLTRRRGLARNARAELQAMSKELLEIQHGNLEPLKKARKELEALNEQRWSVTRQHQPGSTFGRSLRLPEKSEA